jgi:hypothetical protein
MDFKPAPLTLMKYTPLATVSPKSFLPSQLAWNHRPARTSAWNTGRTSSPARL